MLAEMARQAGVKLDTVDKRVLRITTLFVPKVPRPPPGNAAWMSDPWRVSNGGYGSDVMNFSDPVDFIKNVFAHESGHCVGLKHNLLSDKNVMSTQNTAGSGYIKAGATYDQQFWSTFGTSLTGKFRVKK